MVIRELINSGKILDNTENPYREARLILSFVTGMSITDIMVHSEKEIAGEDCKKYISLLEKRKNGMPFAYITGEKEFYGYKFKVTPDVLIPRGDTEILAEFAISKNPKSFIDICTGSGCIAVTVKKECEKTDVTALDISAEALKIAKENAKLNGAEINFLKLDILKEIPEGKYDFLASNPPYIKHTDIEKLEKDVKGFEPSLALDGGENGLMFYERICCIAPKILNKNGMAAFEIGFDQFEDVFKIMKQSFKHIDYIPDFAGIKRVIFGSLSC